MHALDRQHFPRIGTIALAATLLAIVLMLLAASRVGDIGIGGSSVGTSFATRPAASTPARTPIWVTHPFASPFRVTLPWRSPERQ
jgi:hypothetical protein